MTSESGDRIARSLYCALAHTHRTRAPLVQPARGRIGPKYAAWDPNGSNEPAELRNYADNSKRLEIP